jgi:hydrogenase large subunit
VRWLKQEYDRLVDRLSQGDTAMAATGRWDPATWPATGSGIGYTEAPGGALGHWIRIERRKIDHYQCIEPSTWNISPRDSLGQPGPFEAALAGTPTTDPDQPLEILRTIHSFDPCIACATHTLRLPPAPERSL